MKEGVEHKGPHKKGNSIKLLSPHVTKFGCFLTPRQFWGHFGGLLSYPETMMDGGNYFKGLIVLFQMAHTEKRVHWQFWGENGFQKLGCQE